MALKKEPCRNFQRGSCRYGDKCKFLHVTQQQPRPNAFGFGSQTGSSFQQTNTQQQKPNPFGFGVQNSGPTSGTSNPGGFKQSNSFKPFENKWSRSEQPANQSQAANHNCTDPNSCKRQIAEDFEQEKPLWKLTCYGHYKYLPCDITGDVSYEELRAAAYDDHKRGISLQSIVERERNLLNAKLVEFRNLLRNPYTKQTNFAQLNQNPFPTVGHSPFAPSLPPQNIAPLAGSGFGQFNSSVPPQNIATPAVSAFGRFSPSAPPQNIATPAGSGFGQFSPSVPPQNIATPAVSGFGQFAPSSNMTFGVRPSNAPNNAFGQFQGSAGPFGSGNVPSVSFGSQVPVQTSGNPFATNVSGFGNNTINSQPALSSPFPQFQTAMVNQPPTTSNGPFATNGIQQASTNIELIDDNVQREVSAVDPSIWMKEEWKLGEIPEQPPPAQFVM